MEYVLPNKIHEIHDLTLDRKRIKKQTYMSVGYAYPKLTVKSGI